MGDTGVSGFYGKVPKLGDFVSRRLPRTFLDPWDQWLRSCIARSREQLADRWLDTYLTSPIWRFTVSAGVLDAKSWAGILMPSVDKVGRYFPLTLASPLSDETNLLQLTSGASHWFKRAETVALSALEDAEFTLESFDRQVKDLGQFHLPEKRGRAVSHLKRNAWQIPLRSVEDVADTFPQLLSYLLTMRLGSYSLWWSNGSQKLEPSLLIFSGLPPTDYYANQLGS